LTDWQILIIKFPFYSGLVTVTK